MEQGVPGSSYDAGSHRSPCPPLNHPRDECRELSTPRRARPQAWPRSGPNPRDNQGQGLIDAQRQSKKRHQGEIEARHKKGGTDHADPPQKTHQRPSYGLAFCERCTFDADRRSDGLSSREIAPCKKCLRTGRPKQIIAPLPAAASRPDRR